MIFKLVYFQRHLLACPGSLYISDVSSQYRNINSRKAIPDRQYLAGRFAAFLSSSLLSFSALVDSKLGKVQRKNQVSESGITIL